MVQGKGFFLLILLALHFAIPGPAQEKQVYTAHKAIETITDKGLFLEVRMLSDSADNPVLYSAHIVTEVCSDSLCKPVNLVVYWDLLGHFVNYKTPEKEPLTKFDHIEFSTADHVKLHEILADDRSMLKDYEAEDMIDRSVKIYSNKVDAVTGATSKSFQDVIVPGAVYTVHTLWHIVNGPVAAKILAHTRGLLNDTLIKHMLTSGNSDYQRFVLTDLPAGRLKPFAGELIGLIASQDEFIPHFAMEKIPAALWKEAVAQQLILAEFAGLRLEVQNALLQKFKDQPLHAAGLRILLRNIGKLDKNQVEKVFKIIENSIGFILTFYYPLFISRTSV